MSENNRIDYLDSIRGLMIIWMLVVHISLNYGIIKYGEIRDLPDTFSLMSFFMTPFYVFSGFLFSDKRSFCCFTKNKINKLIIPYLFFTVFGILIFETYCLIKDRAFDFSFLGSFLPTACFKTNTPCWFFISLFFVSEIYYILNRYLTKKWMINSAIAMCFIFAFITKGWPQIFGYGNVLLGLVYFHFGKILKDNESLLIRKRILILLIAIIGYVLFGVFFPSTLSFVLNIIQGNYLFNLFFSISACFLLWVIFQLIPDGLFINKGLQYMGRISLVVFASHRPILRWVWEPCFYKLIPDGSFAVFLLSSIVILLIVSVLLYKLLERYLPVIIGKRSLL